MNFIVLLITIDVWSVVIGVASIVIAILIFFLQKQIRYPDQLKFAIIEKWKVRRTSPNGYGELSLKYNDYVIEEELNYVKFILYNKKSYDYSSGDENNPVRIILPDGCKWVDAKIVGQSKDVQANVINQDSKELGLIFKLLRKNEYIEIDGIIESNNSIKNLGDEISILHRIANVSSVKHMPLLSSGEYKQAKRMIIVLGTFLVFFLYIIFNALAFRPASPLKFKELESGDIRLMCVDKGGGIVYHKGMFIWNGYSEPITQDEFMEKYELYLGLPHFENSDYFFLTFFSIVFLLVTYIIVGVVISLLKSNEIKRVMLK